MQPPDIWITPDKLYGVIIQVLVRILWSYRNVSASKRQEVEHIVFFVFLRIQIKNRIVTVTSIHPSIFFRVTNNTHLKVSTQRAQIFTKAQLVPHQVLMGSSWLVPHPPTSHILCWNSSCSFWVNKTTNQQIGENISSDNLLFSEVIINYWHWNHFIVIPKCKQENQRRWSDQQTELSEFSSQRIVLICVVLQCLLRLFYLITDYCKAWLVFVWQHEMWISQR